MTTHAVFYTSNGLAPKNNPAVARIALEFTANHHVFRGDFISDEDRERINDIQSVYIDNGENAAPLKLVIGITGQRIIIPAEKQGIFPVYSPTDNTSFEVESPVAADTKVTLFFSNMPQPTMIW